MSRVDVVNIMAADILVDLSIDHLHISLNYRKHGGISEVHLF